MSTLDEAKKKADLAENLLDLARAKAEQRGLMNIQFETGDMTNVRSSLESWSTVPR